MLPGNEPSDTHTGTGTGTEYGGLLGSLRGLAPWAVTPSAPPAKGPGTAVRPDTDTDADADADADADTGDGWVSCGRTILERCSAHPDRTALSDGAEEISYGELAARTDTLAAALAGAGVGRGDIVALVIDRGLEFVIALLAVWRAGAAYLPLSASYPEPYLTGVAAQAEVALVLGRPIPGFRHLATGPPAGEPMAADRKRTAVAAAAVEDTNTPGDLAYVIATSGSTGTPKLVMIEHRGPARLIGAQRDVLGPVPPHSRVLQYAHPAFDAALFDILLALANGARLEVLADPHVAGDALAEVLARRRVTHAVLPAAVLRTLRPGRLPELDVVMSIGEVCLPETARRWAAHHRFFNGYGPTETTICATLHRADGTEATRVPIGRPVPGWHVVLLDGRGEPVGKGAVGEICIGGAGVGRGYLGLPELTKERFIRGPGGARLYRSGDLGRIRADGAVEYLGRADDQVKLRGARIEPGQIEAALAALPGVHDAVALLDRRGEPRLLGYVTADGSLPGSEELRAALARTLPEYLVPERVITVERWPLTVSGKVDRAALPRPGRAAGGPAAAPANATEAAVAEAAAELLGLDEVGVQDDLFACGGTSLFAAQLSARLRAGLGVEVPLGTVLDGRTPAVIAERIGRNPPAGPGPRPGRESPEPSHAQRRVWLMHGLNPGARAYHSQSVIRLAGNLSLPALEASLTRIVAAHEVLRSRFPTVDGELTCVVDEPWPVGLEVRDLSRSGDQDAAVGTVVGELLRAPFDLAHEPPFRWALLRIGAEEHLLVHAEHHLVHDGWSFRLFLRELLDGYSEYLAHGRVDREPPRVGYYDYARWQREWLGSDEAHRQRAFWRAELDGAETVLRLPHRGAGSATEFRGAAPRVEIDGELARRLADLAERGRVSLFTVLLCAYFVLLHHYTGSRDILIGSAVANRRWRQTEELLGMFVNTVIFRGRLDGDPAFTSLMRLIHERSIAVLDHQELPYDLAFAESAARSGESARPLVQTMFSFHDAPLGPLRPTPLEVTVIEGVANGSSKLDVSVVAVPRYAQPGRISQLPGDLISVPRSADPVPGSDRTVLEGITLAWEFDTDLFDGFFRTRMTEAFTTLLRSVADAPDTPLSRLVPMDGRTREEVLEWGRGPTVEPPSDWLPDLVARWVGETPHALAVGGAPALTYAELGAWSDRVARRLRARGLGRGDVVAVLLPRGPELVVAQLAVMKSGAAYLPCDPAHPGPRLAALMADCGAKTVLTSEEFAAATPRGATALTLERMPACGGEPPGDPGAGSDACYVIHTSGSSGAPKGVVVEHRSITGRLYDDGVTGLAPGAVLLAVASPAFDVSVLEVWGPLVHGATVRFLPPYWDTTLLARGLRQRGVTHAALSAAVFHELVAQDPEALRGLRRVVVAGDVLSPEAVLALRARGIRRISNGYGPTETSVLVSGVPLDEWQPAGRVPIGRPLPNTSLYVLDERLRPVPPGAVGEICVGGRVVARGYMRPSEAFVPDPFGPGTLYRTGDRGRWLDGGLLDFAGRADDQVKIRGHRVEPAEVRAALLGLECVRDAVVVADREADRLVAHALTTWTGDAVRHALAEVLPSYLVPSAVATYTRLPANGSGKVDIARLARTPPSAAADRAPAPLEQLIIELVGDVAGVRPGVHDNLFDIGMHSLQVMRLTARITASTGLAAGLVLVLTHPTVAGLAAALESAPPADGAIPRAER
ncbi:non-ribosomal peptide synthetase [Streptomyces yaizuensis]|uniref:Amino acid adenylation domain-containing protein n=1 Tax=Streptomyces yaizuensis TaxID=2989713 RepID=A0ABQ5NYH2_9ACTN|nr:non-ribosomal peptide synthetase [Streptomyces sp. YSPA8]GLF95304.1 amino acid adenylation domain-containing protein [Streptomyces sp. YSPA8]